MKRKKNIKERLIICENLRKSDKLPATEIISGIFTCSLCLFYLQYVCPILEFKKNQNTTDQHTMCLLACDLCFSVSHKHVCQDYLSAALQQSRTSIVTIRLRNQPFQAMLSNIFFYKLND